MNKTISINLNGIIFHIDEDAHQLLQDYLNTFVFNDVSLNRIGCKYDDISRKFRFFRDYRVL